MKNLGSLMAAYLFAWAIFFVYHLTVAQRLARLQDEVKQLKETLMRGCLGVLELACTEQRAVPPSRLRWDKFRAPLRGKGRATWADVAAALTAC